MAAACAAIISTHPAFASNSFGIGGDSCGQWIPKSVQNHDLIQIAQHEWVLGYISGFNKILSHSNFTAGQDSEGLLAWLDNYCAAHPLDRIADATTALIDELLERKQNSAH